MTPGTSRAILAANLRKLIEHDLGPGSRFSILAWCKSRNLQDSDVRLISRLVAGDNVSIQKLDELAHELGLKPWQLLLEDFDPAGKAPEPPLTEEDRALLRRLRRVIGSV